LPVLLAEVHASGDNNQQRRDDQEISHFTVSFLKKEKKEAKLGLLSSNIDLYAKITRHLETCCWDIKRIALVSPESQLIRFTRTVSSVANGKISVPCNFVS